MNKYFKVMYASAKMSLMREMEYRADFVMFFLQTATFVFFNLLFYKVILGNINSMGDWNYPDMVVLFGTYTIIDSIFMTFVLTNVSRIESYVRKGTLDSFLVKPLDSQFLISTQNVNLPQLPAIVFGVAIVCYGFRIGHYNIPTLNVLLYLLFILSSAVIIYAMTVVLNCVIFVIDKAEELTEIIFSVKQFAKFPDIYSGYIRYVLMFMAPIVFSSFVPAGALLGKVNTKFALYYFIISILSLVVARVVWKNGLKRYKSAGG